MLYMMQTRVQIIRINHSAEYASGLGNYDQKMDNERIDKILYYVNGQLFGYTYYGHDSYINGCNTFGTMIIALSL